MLEKEKLMILLQQEKYLDILNIFRDEYKIILIEFAKKHKIIANNDDVTLSSLLLKIKRQFPDFEGYVNLIERALFDENVQLAESLDIMVSDYNEIKKVFNNN
jgi:hypothetical protein